jgi:hypothetical protein
MAVGTATRNVRNEKTIRAWSEMPLVNMWCAHTSEPIAAMSSEEKTMNL